MEAMDIYKNFLDTNGMSLSALGICGHALTRDAALRAVTILRSAHIPVLGGDVYFKRAGRIVLAYANWHADPKPTEAREAYLSRSWDTTETYVRRFPDTKDAEPLFVFVVG